MSAQGRLTQLRARRIVYGLLYAALLPWSLPSHAEAPSSRSEHRIVYRCLRDGVVTLTDVPCDGERVDIDLNRNLSVAPSPIAVVREEPRKTKQPTAETSAAKQREAQQQRCNRLHEQLGTLRAKQRSGYTARAGIRMEERRRQLQAKSRSAKCP